jgi:hypothetical protein
VRKAFLLELMESGKIIASDWLPSQRDFPSLLLDQADSIRSKVGNFTIAARRADEMMKAEMT